MDCIAVDDEPRALHIIEEYGSKIPFLNLRASFRDPLKAIEYLQSHPVDLVFLDINMPALSGMQFVDALSQHPQIIFTTAYHQFAVESYEKKAIDYLLKPIEFDRFLAAVTRAHDILMLRTLAGKKEQHLLNDTSIFIKSGTQLHKVPVQEILYLEKGGHYVIFHTQTKRILTRLTLQEIFQVVPTSEFVQVHKSFVVPLSKVEMVEVDQVMIGKSKIPLGSTYREEFMKRLQGK